MKVDLLAKSMTRHYGDEALPPMKKMKDKGENDEIRGPKR
jgi:hypothetical protein